MFHIKYSTNQGNQIFNYQQENKVNHNWNKEKKKKRKSNENDLMKGRKVMGYLVNYQG